ncbi:MAG: RDD family protein [Thomasclavelia sp.]
MATKVEKRKRNKKKKYHYIDASMTKRFISYLIDWYVGGLCTAIPIAITSQKLTNTMLNQNIIEFKAPYGLIAGIFAIFFAIFYFVIVPTYIYPGQTVGKRICKIKIIQIDDQPITIKNMLLRNLVGMIIIEGVLVSASAIWHEVVTIITQVNFVTPLMYAGFVVSAISILLYLFKGEHRALHDYLGKTKVVACN